MSIQPKTFVSPEEYLELERRSEERHEYYRGEIFAMSGGSATHSRLGARVIVCLERQLEGGSCSVYTSDLRIHIPATGLYTYPDASVVCGEPAFLDAEVDTLLNPMLVVEVLSPSTEKYDRGNKFHFYGSILSLQEYVLVGQERRQIEVFRRGGEGLWLLQIATEGEVELQSVGCRLSVEDVYLNIELQEGSSQE